LAQPMGYDFACTDTSDFLADGLTNVAARIRYVFTRLVVLNKCVMLFADIEEFAKDRKQPGSFHLVLYADDGYANGHQRFANRSIALPRIGFLPLTRQLHDLEGLA
jgi:hypothetical protein